MNVLDDFWAALFGHPTIATAQSEAEAAAERAAEGWAVAGWQPDPNLLAPAPAPSVRRDLTAQHKATPEELAALQKRMANAWRPTADQEGPK